MISLNQIRRDQKEFNSWTPSEEEHEEFKEMMREQIKNSKWNEHIQKTTKEVQEEMATIKETALGYHPPQTKNIADLPEVPVDLELYDGSGTDKNGDKFEYKYADLNGEQYRVPNSVLGSIKDILESSPNTKKVKVKKSGDGLATRYTVIPLGN